MSLRHVIQHLAPGRATAARAAARCAEEAGVTLGNGDLDAGMVWVPLWARLVLSANQHWISVDDAVYSWVLARLRELKDDPKERAYLEAAARLGDYSGLLCPLLSPERVRNE